MVDKFLHLYDPTPPRWNNLTSVVSELDWPSVTAQTTSEYLDSHGVEGLFARELVEAATRVNYGQASRRVNCMGTSI